MWPANAWILFFTVTVMDIVIVLYGPVFFAPKIMQNKRKHTILSWIFFALICIHIAHNLFGDAILVHNYQHSNRPMYISRDLFAIQSLISLMENIIFVMLFIYFWIKKRHNIIKLIQSMVLLKLLHLIAVIVIFNLAIDQPSLLQQYAREYVWRKSLRQMTPNTTQTRYILDDDGHLVPI